MEKITTCTKSTSRRSIPKQKNFIRKDVSMSEVLTPIKTAAPPTPHSGKVNIDALREALAHLMDTFKMLQDARANLSRAVILYDGKICQLPAISIPGHEIGLPTKTVMEKGQPVERVVFTLDGISVMDAPPVTDLVESVTDAGHGKEDGSHGDG
jgi:hypothetical protein